MGVLEPKDLKETGANNSGNFIYTIIFIQSVCKFAATEQLNNLFSWIVWLH